MINRQIDELFNLKMHSIINNLYDVDFHFHISNMDAAGSSSNAVHRLVS